MAKQVCQSHGALNIRSTGPTVETVVYGVKSLRGFGRLKFRSARDNRGQSRSARQTPSPKVVELRTRARIRTRRLTARRLIIREPSFAQQTSRRGHAHI